MTGGSEADTCPSYLDGSYASNSDRAVESLQRRQSANCSHPLAALDSRGRCTMAGLPLVDEVTW